MYNTNKPAKTSIVRNTSYKGETIEQKIVRITNNNEPIKDGAPLIYTERQDGVIAAYDITTDRFDIAVEAMGAVAKTNLAKREGKLEALKGGKDETKKDSGAESLQATDPK